MLERVISTQLREHIELHQLANPLQSAYRKKHSTEAALLKVQSDISAALDNSDMVILVMLDLSTAFETLDHSIMLSRLCDMYGIQGDALEWVRSYLDLRSQCVKLLGTESADKILTFVMPQGSILGAEFYCHYSKPVGKIILYHAWITSAMLMILRYI